MKIAKTSRELSVRTEEKMASPLFGILPQKGVYTLVIVVKSPDHIQVNKLGDFIFQRGYYAYTGSAMNNLRKRVERHLRRNKSKHWHIDFLLNSDQAKTTSVIASTAKKNNECRINKAIMAITGSSSPVSGFGASDCRQGCKSHLAYFGARNPEREISNLYRTMFKTNVTIVTARALGIRNGHCD